ncbi:4-vinyl reductase domain-containing protein [Aromatoleum petrolei]|nr:4-vinyl reductase domain-containing protein [Aromatoleum petrolei]
MDSMSAGQDQDDDGRAEGEYESIRLAARSFCLDTLQDLETGMGDESYGDILYHASYKSAGHWCEKEAFAHGLAGVELFEHYLERLSARGWGRFSLAEADFRTGTADVRLDHSTLVLSQAEACAARTCYMFAGWFAGMMDWIGENAGKPLSTVCCETQCGADGFDHCIFAIRPRLLN